MIMITRVVTALHDNGAQKCISECTRLRWMGFNSITSCWVTLLSGKNRNLELQ